MRKSKTAGLTRLPERDVRMEVRLTRAMHAALVEMARVHGRTVAGEIRHAISGYIGSTSEKAA